MPVQEDSAYAHNVCFPSMGRDALGTGIYRSGVAWILHHIHIGVGSYCCSFSSIGHFSRPQSVDRTTGRFTLFFCPFIPHLRTRLSLRPEVLIVIWNLPEPHQMEKSKEADRHPLHAPDLPPTSSPILRAKFKQRVHQQGCPRRMSCREDPSNRPGGLHSAPLTDANSKPIDISHHKDSKPSAPQSNE